MTVNSSAKTSVIAAGILVMGVEGVLQNIDLAVRLKVKYESYLVIFRVSYYPCQSHYA